jgi:hypothetical protein
VRTGVFVLGIATAAAAVVVGSSSGATARQINQRSIGNVPLGLTRTGYLHKLGKATFTTRFGHGLTRLAYADRGLAIYLSRKGRGLAVLTSEDEYRTAAAVGPCSTVAALKRAYGARLKPMRRGSHVVAYRLRRLVFATPSGNVAAVMLSGSGFPVNVVVNAGLCGGGEGE